MATVLATTVLVASLPELLGVRALTSNRPREVLLGFGNVAPDAVLPGTCHQSSGKVLLQEKEVIKSPLGAAGESLWGTQDNI